MEFPIDDEELLDERNKLLQICNMDEQTMFYKWESWCLQRGNTPKLDLDTFKAFAKDMKFQMERQVKATLKQNPERKSIKQIPGMNIDSILGLPVKTTASGDSLMQESKPSTETFELNSSDAGRVLEVLNKELKIVTSKPSAPSKLVIVANFDLKAFNYRIMYQKLYDSSEVLDDRIELFSALTCRKYNISDEDLANPSELTQEPVVVVGRIVVESTNLGGRLNQNSILLESSRRLGAGVRVRLKVDDLPSYSIFPGQIVSVKGSNPSGNMFIAKEILPIPPLPFPSSSKQEHATFVANTNNQPISIYIASGPWSLRDDLSFSPLKSMISYVNKNPVDLVILCGPFLDINHILIRTGNITGTSATSLEELFKERVTPILSQLTCPCILIPHINDAASDHPAWPQDAFNRVALGLPSNFKCFPNPCMFSINDVVFGVSTNDILLHTSREELFRLPSHGNLFARLVSHVLHQRHFYPLFPGGSLERCNPSNLDIAHLKLGEFLNTMPDILILPSDLRYFVKNVENVVSLNPGKATKGINLGTFAKLTIAPLELEDNGSSNHYSHRVWLRTKAEILKL
ncbi:DNA polymerase alpha subunit B [Schizosaccharomyces pombe]